MTEQTENLSELLAARREKLASLRAQGQAYSNTFKRAHLAADLLRQYQGNSAEQLESLAPVKIAGRIMLKRVMGKASFIQVQDMSARIQVYLAKDQLSESVYEAFKHWDVGDIVGVQGHLFKTKTGELTVKASEICLVVGFPE